MIRAVTDARRRESFRKWMTARGLSVAEIARTAKVPATTIYSFLQGASKSMSGQTQDLIAHVYNSSVPEMFGAVGQRWLPVAGAIAPSGEAHVGRGIGARVPRPVWMADGDGVVVYRIAGLETGLGVRDWLVMFKDARAPAASLVGELALAELADGRRLFCRLRGPVEGNAVHIESIDGAALDGILVTKATPFLAMALPSPT